MIAAALLLIGLGAMHSILGGRRLIVRICALTDLPIILGSRRNTELTLTIGWHLLTVFWVYLAGLLLCIHFQVPSFHAVFVDSLGILSILCGVTALGLSSGKHLSWVLFFPLGAVLWIAQVA